MNRLCPTCEANLIKEFFDDGELVPYDPDEPMSIMFCSDECRDEHREQRNW